MIRFLNVFSLLALTIMICAPAQAAVDAQGAQKLKTLFKNMIERQKDASTISGSEFRTTGDVVIEPAGSYYAVTLPNITAIDANGRRAELGMIAINAIPGDKDGQWKMSVAWPSPVTFINKEGKPEMKVDIGAQRMAGLFDESMENFTKLDAAYQNIRIEHYEKDNIVTIPKITLKYNLEEKQPGVFSGPMIGTVEKIKINDGAQNELLFIESGSFKVDVADISAAENKEMQKEFKSLADRAESSGGNVTADDKKAVFGAIMKTFESLGNGFSSQYNLNGIRINMPENQGTDGPTKVQLAKIGFGFDMQGFRENNLNVNLRMGYEGLQMFPEPPSFQDVGPQTMTFDVSLKDIPFQELSDLAENSLDTSLQNPAAAQMAKVQAMMALPQLLTASGTNLTINNASFKSKIAQADFSGKIKADANAVSGGTGFINATMTGLDELMSIAQKAAIESRDKQKKTNLAKIFPALVLLRGTAEQERDENGKTVYKFRMTLDKDGQTMINTTEINALKNAVE